LSDIPKNKFTKDYYDSEYFAGSKGGKTYRKANGTLEQWSYWNLEGEWLGCKPITEAWKEMFHPKNLLDVGCGRGQIVAYARDLGIEAYGFDFSEWAVGDEGRYKRTKREWLEIHDATEPWPYATDSFDLVSALDFFEHIYEDDLSFVMDELYRVSKRWVFLQIAVSGTGGLQGRDESGYVLRKDEEIPMGLEGCAVAGHVTVIPEDTWIEKLERDNVFLRRDLKEYFISLVPNEVIGNWLQNSIIVLEVMEEL